MKLPDGAGFIGLGNIGRPMAARLADWPGGLWVYDVDPAATAVLERAGAHVAPSPRDVAAHAGVISVMVRDDEQVRSVITGPDGVLAGAAPGTVIAVHSTIRRRDGGGAGTRRWPPHGVGVLDAPVSGGATGAKNGTARDHGAAARRTRSPRPSRVLDRMGAARRATSARSARGRAPSWPATCCTSSRSPPTTEANRVAEAAGIDLQVLGQIVRHTDAITGGPGAIMLRDTTAPIEPGDPWFAILDAVRILGEKDLTFAIELAEQLGCRRAAGPAGT